MRLKKPYKKCRFCKTEVPIQLFLYEGYSENKNGIFRHYRCPFCKSTIYGEKVTNKELWSGEIEDPKYCGEKTIYGYKYSGI